MKEQIIVFSDHIGRIVGGKLAGETDTQIIVANPVIIHCEPQPQTGQLQVHTYPYIFMEFIAPDKRDQVEWTFDKASIAISNVELDDRLENSVLNINNPQAVQAAAAAPQGDAKVINLFDEE